MSDLVNKKVLLVARPRGLPDASCFEVVEEALNEPCDGEVLVEVTHLSIDPAMRAWIDPDSYMGPMQLGETMRALGVGRVVHSEYPDLSPGDSVQGPMGVQKYCTFPGALLRKISEDRVPPSAFVGALGLTGGLTAYFGILDVGALGSSDTLLVSGAAGAVGSIVGQIGRIVGARVVGIAGGPEKVRFVTDELGFDACIDYKAGDIEAAIGAALPDGIDVYFDNVGGEILDAALGHIREGARVVICGAISQYNDRHEGRVRGPGMYLRLAERNARMEGFIVTRFASRFPEAEEQLIQWLAAGELVVVEHIEKGVENFHATFLKLFDGSHIGKLLLQP